MAPAVGGPITKPSDQPMPRSAYAAPWPRPSSSAPLAASGKIVVASVVNSGPMATSSVSIAHEGSGNA